MQKADRLEWWPRGNVRVNPRNVRSHPAEMLDQLAAQMRKVWTFPILVVEDADNPRHGEIIAGHARLIASAIAGYHEEVKVLVAEGWSREQIEQYVIWDNQSALLSAWDEAALKTQLEWMRGEFGEDSTADIGFSQDQLDAILNPKAERVGVVGSLAEAFGVPPFTVINARGGWWQARKAGWRALGIKSEIGRGDHVEGKASHAAAPGGGGRLYAGRDTDGKTAAATRYGRPVKRKPNA